MKLKYIGLIFIIVGFFSPFIMKRVFPANVYAFVVYLLFFRIGFLLILRPNNFTISLRPYARWASHAIWINITLIIISPIFYFFILSANYSNEFGLMIARHFGIIINPVRTVFNFLFTQPVVEHADGSVTGTISVSRAMLTDFLNLAFYCLIGVLAKLIAERKITSVFTGRRGPRRP